MAERILLEDFQKDKAIELSDGVVLNIPERSAELSEKIEKIVAKNKDITEYDYCKEILETLFGTAGFKKIAPNGKKINLDYLEKVQLVSLNLFMSEKIEAEREEMERRVENLAPLTDRLNTLNPIINKMK